MAKPRIDYLDNSYLNIPSNKDKLVDKLTKREHFAAMAMQGFIAGREYDLCDIDYLTINYIAIDAVKTADALIKELNK